MEGPLELVSVSVLLEICPIKGKIIMFNQFFSISVKMIEDVCCLITGVMNSAFVYGSQG